ncbi:hypothetical protein JTB14_020128 [Gonioctena quinquepunctata]|nr:hypothetical protein JTB14_020128 [Gonioctena quinquepunctata]
MKKMNEVAVGIDLGTTFSCVAVYRGSKTEVIPDRNGDRLIPSIVYFEPETGNVLVDSKRILGRKFDDEFIARYCEQQDTQFSIVRGNEDEAVFQLKIQDKYVRKTPEEVSAEILKYLKTTASEYLGKDVKEAVISIPAYFSNAQKKATKRAADLAGIQLLKFITEPSAGALHYKQGKNTCRPVDRNSKKFTRRLQHNCEKLKRDLPNLKESTVYLECYDGANDLELSLTRDECEDLTKDIFQRAVDIVEYGIADTGWKISQVYEVILVGGSTRIPKISNLLERLFGREKLRTDLNPDEVVALGACIQAAMLKKEFTNAEKFKITEVTPLSLGLGGDGNLMTNSKRILGRKFDDEFIARYSQQKDTQFSIVRGDDDNAVLFPDGNTRRMCEKIITEPSAGALHYKQGKNENSKLVVFDWGGGTLDVSLIQIENKMFKFESVYGDTLLGGKNIDHILFN